MRSLFIDLDGVLGDFFGCYRELFGRDLDRTGFDQSAWNDVNTHPTFFVEMPKLHDADELWEGALQLHPAPIVLTGYPEHSPHVAGQKVEWVRRNLPGAPPPIVCLSREKFRHGNPGDVLIDDWARYRHLWEEMGGVFVHHTSAMDSLKHAGEWFKK
jgi:hypothetical protein